MYEIFYLSIYLGDSEKDRVEWILAAAALIHIWNKMVFFRQAIFLHFAYMKRLWVRGLCCCFRALSRKENIHITQNEWGNNNTPICNNPIYHKAHTRATQ